MKAAIFEDIEKIRVEDVPVPACDADGILVNVKACGLCGGDIRNYHNGLKGGVTNQIMGHEIAGVVEEVGRDAARFTVGDRVAIAPDVSCGQCYYCRRGLVNLCLDHKMLGTHWPGGFAQFVHLPKVVLERGMVHHMPEGLSFQDATLAEPASSVLAAQHNAGVGLGDTVLIIGDGPIGCLHLEVARSRGASTVIMAGLTRLDIAKNFEPEYLIDAGSQDTVQEVLNITAGLGADVAILANPVVKTQEQGIESVRKRGTVVLFGGVPKNQPMTTLNSNLIHYNELTVMGAFSYPAYINEMALRVIHAGQITASKYITKVVSLENMVTEGIAAAEAGKALKVVIDPWL
jgi:L-iditol 2-dehydrogenase